MNPAERHLVEFIAVRLESMLRRPAVWGSNLSVEEQVLQLLEIRRVLLDPASKMDGRRAINPGYRRYVAKAVPSDSATPLAVRLGEQGRDDEFVSILQAYVALELAEVTVETNVPIDPADRATIETEERERIIERIRAEARDEALTQPQKTTPIEFPTAA